MPKFKELDEKINKYLRLETYPIAIKLIENEEDLKEIKFLKKPDKQLALCQIFSYSRYYGWTMSCTKDDNLCPLAEIAIGFEEPHDLFKEGAFFVGRYNESKEAAKKTASTMPFIEKGKFSAIVSGALNRVEYEPDLIMIWGNSAQIMRIIQGDLWKEGGRVTLSTFCDGVCADTIAEAYNTKKLQIAFPCLGDRRFGLAKDSDLIATIPFEIIDTIIDGIEKTHKAGTRYPIPYQLSSPEFFIKLKKQLNKAKKTKK